MSQPPRSEEPASPIDEFSDCHAGLLTRLSALGTLPSLLEPAARARKIAADALDFFNKVLYEHHGDEERELFPAVLASATEGDERDRVQHEIDRLTGQHREVEEAWRRLVPALRRAAKGQEVQLDTEGLARLVERYAAHARYEEQIFLPLARDVLGRNANHLAALGVSLHMRHALPQVMDRYGHML